MYTPSNRELREFIGDYFSDSELDIFVLIILWK